MDSTLAKGLAVLEWLVRQQRDCRVTDVAQAIVGALPGSAPSTAAVRGLYGKVAGVALDPHPARQYQYWYTEGLARRNLLWRNL